MIKEKGYHKLRVVKAIKEFIFAIYEITEKFPKSEEYGLKSQLRRAAVSILLNTVEGHRKKSDKEFYRFLETADCSCAECEVALELSLDLQFITLADFEKTESKRQEVAFMLVKLMKTVQLSIKK